MDRTTVAPVSREFAAHGFRVEGKSDIGRGGRDENQDFMNAFVAGDTVLAVVADGMGGHSGGFEASRIAVQATIADDGANGADPTPANNVGTPGIVSVRVISLEKCASYNHSHAAEFYGNIIYGKVNSSTWIPLGNCTNYYVCTTLYGHRKTDIQPHCHFRWQS